MINRLTAYKVWISDLVNSNYVQTSGEFESNYIDLNSKQITRVNIIATVVNKIESEDKNYISLVLDDGTEQIRIKTWREDTKLLNKINVSDIILVIGKIKRYNDEVYILPEIVKNVTLNWELARKFELFKLYGKPKEIKIQEILMQEEKPIIEEISFSSSNLRKELLGLVDKHEDRFGVTLEEIKNELNFDSSKLNEILEELIKEGQIYSVNNRLRLVV